MEFSLGLLQNPPLGGTPSSVLKNTYNLEIVVKKIKKPMEFYNLDRCSIYNDQHIKKQTYMKTKKT